MVQDRFYFFKKNRDLLLVTSRVVFSVLDFISII